MIRVLPFTIGTGESVYAPGRPPEQVAGLQLLSPERPANQYGRYTDQDPVSLRILDQIRVTMSGIDGVIWATFGDSILPVKGAEMPGILIRQLSDREVEQQTCRVISEMAIDIAGFIRISDERSDRNPWRQNIWKLQNQIVQAIRANGQWARLARKTTITTKQIYEPVERLCACDVSMVVQYATKFSDPSQPV